eukprot:6208118-Pleurochrysis_carterae.AAC.2
MHLVRYQLRTTDVIKYHSDASKRSSVTPSTSITNRSAGVCVKAKPQRPSCKQAAAVSTILMKNLQMAAINHYIHPNRPQVVYDLHAGTKSVVASGQPTGVRLQRKDTASM